MIRVLDPVAPAVVDRIPLAARRMPLDGLRLGVLSNGKPNAANLMRVAQHRMERRYSLAEVVFIDKVEAGLMAGDGAPDWMLEQLAACDAVLHGGGD